MIDRAIGGTQLRRALGPWQQDRTPAYLSLAEALRSLVLDGKIPLQTRLPAERELSAVLSLSRTTVGGAYRLLRDEGFLSSRQGAGSWTALPAGAPVPPAGLWPGLSEGAEAIDFSVAALSAPQPWISKAMEAAVSELPAYTRSHGSFPGGLPVLKEAVAQRYEQRGLPTSPHQIMITSGASGAIALLLQTLVRPPDRVAVDSPSYANTLHAIRVRGARPVPVALLDDGWDTDAWAQTFREAAPRLAYVLADFHNPSGLLMNDDQRRELVRLARSAGTTLLVDETMAELGLDLHSPAPRPLAAHDRGGTVVTVGSAAKIFWSGLRIGWIRANTELIQRLTADRLSLDISSPVIEQLAVRHLLTTHLQDVFTHQRNRVRRNRDALVAALRQELPAWTFTVPDGGLVLWVHMDTSDLRSSTGRPVTGGTLVEAAKKRGVRMAAGPQFGVDGALERYVRLAFTQPPDASREAAYRLATTCRSLLGG